MRAYPRLRPVVVFGRSESGIEWNSPDGKASHFIFLILTPKEDDDIQIQILRIIATAMSSINVRQALMLAHDREAIWGTLQESFALHHVVRRPKK